MRADPATPAVPRPALSLGLAGLIPFVALALAAVIAPEGWAGVARDLLVGYGATILAFMGGCRWGFAAAGLGSGPTFWPLALSVVPSLWAWGALAAPHPFDLALLTLGLAFLYVADVVLAMRGGAPAWWPALRRPLTWVACGSLALAMAA